METTDEAERRFEHQYADSNRNLAAGLGGTSVAIMTFFLFFGFDRAASGQIDETLFQATLGFIILTIFLFVFTATYYYVYMEALSKRHSNARSQLRKADSLFFAALGAITLEPSLIMFTAKLTEVGAVALVLWLVFLVLQVVNWRRFRHSAPLSRPVPGQSNQT